MKLSFVIPAYNEEKFIGPCLESVLRDATASGRDFEVVVVNNASQDRTKEVAASYAGVKVVDEPQKGLVRARDAGYHASTGDLIANVDADVELPTGWTDKVFAEFEANPNLVALSGPYIYKDVSRWQSQLIRLYYDVVIINHHINHDLLKRGAVLQGGNFVVRREALEKIGGYNHQFEFYGEDTDVACRIQRVGTVKFTRALPMYTSNRRLQGEGYLKSSAKYVVNYLWTLNFKKPFTKSEQDFRDEQPAKTRRD